MAKDPTAFRERFKAYKDGKSVKEIYDGGLPRYAEGTPDFSDEEAMEYILQLENPHRIGYSKGIWRTPKDSSKYDVHQIGGGLDIREEHNPIVYNYLKSKGRLNNPWLTEAEEKALRMQTWKGKKANMDKFVAKYGDKLSLLGYNTAAGMLWHGHPFKMMNTADSITGKALANAMASGDKDLDTVFDTYYRYGTNAKRFASRIDANTKYRKAYKPTVIAPITELIEQLDNTPKFQPWSNYHGTDYPINNPAPASISSWNSPLSPAYTPVEYNANQSYLRLPNIKDVIEQSIMMPKFKDGKLPGYRTGTIPYVSSDGTSYNINPNVVGSDLLNITTPEVVVTGKDRRPMYLRYNAENSTYNPNTIRNFTDWMPIVSDVGDSLDAYNAFKNKDYTTAATLTGLLFLPNLAENIGKYAYRGLRRIGIPQMFTKELLQNGEAAWKRFKNLDLFDKIRGIKYTDNVWHGSNTAFDINHARAYTPVGMDTGFHMGSSPTPAYSRANGLLGGVIYSGKLKMKEAPFELDDLNRWGWREIVAESDNNPAFKKYLEDKGIDIDRLVNTATDLEKEYDTLDAIGQQAYLKEHGGFESDKYMAKLFKDKNISLKYKNKFETFDGVPEYSYAIYNPNNVVWNKLFTFSKKQNDLLKLYDLGLAGKYDFNDPDKITVNLDNLYRVLKDFPKYRLPGHKDGKSPIHIKPANRGKLTNLKKRTGKSEAELYKTGGPAVRKMITFARNARKWKH